MGRAIVTFLIMWGAIYYGAGYFYNLKRNEKLDIVKQLMYSMVAAIMTMSLLILIVFLF